jgi:hypothetical protein
MFKVISTPPVDHANVGEKDRMDGAGAYVKRTLEASKSTPFMERLSATEVE